MQVIMSHWPFLNSPRNYRQNGRKTVAAVRKHPRIKVVDSKLSRSHQDGAICGRAARLQGPFGYEYRYTMAKELVVSMLHQGALDRLCEFVPTDVPMETFTVAPTCTELQK